MRFLPAIAFASLLGTGCDSSFFAAQESGALQTDWGYYQLLRRTPAEERADKAVIRQIKKGTKQMREESGVRINVYSFNGIVLLLGTAPDYETLEQVVKIAENIPRVKQVHNFINIAQGASFTQRLASSWLAIQTTFSLADLPNGIQQRTQIIAERNAVYVMGIIRLEEKQMLENMIGEQLGVRQLIFLTEILN